MANLAGDAKLLISKEKNRRLRMNADPSSPIRSLSLSYNFSYLFDIFFTIFFH